MPHLRVSSARLSSSSFSHASSSISSIVAFWILVAPAMVCTRLAGRYRFRCSDHCLVGFEEVSGALDGRSTHTVLLGYAFGTLFRRIISLILRDLKRSTDRWTLAGEMLCSWAIRSRVLHGESRWSFWSLCFDALTFPIGPPPTLFSSSYSCQLAYFLNLIFCLLLHSLFSHFWRFLWYQWPASCFWKYWGDRRFFISENFAVC